MRVLTTQQKNSLHHWKQGQCIEYRLRFRATIVWGLYHHHKSISQVAEENQTTTKTVRKWRDRFEDRELSGLFDLPRSGAPRKFSVEQRCEVIALACDRPKAYGYSTHHLWSLDILTAAARRHTIGPAMSRSSVHRTLRNSDLKPHRNEMWLHSRDPLFREKVNNLVSLYLNPPPGAVVLCIDEKTGMQALERKEELVPAAPGRPGRYEYEYIRHGTRSLIAAFNIQTGHVTAQCRQTRTADDLIAFMTHVAKVYPKKKIIVIWDNLNIHHEGASARWSNFNKKHKDRFEFHYTPLHASWVNQVEIFFSILHKRCLRYSDFQSAEEMETTVMTFISQWNTVEGHPFEWTFGGYPMQGKQKEAS